MYGENLKLLESRGKRLIMILDTNNHLTDKRLKELTEEYHTNISVSSSHIKSHIHFFEKLLDHWDEEY